MAAEPDANPWAKFPLKTTSRMGEVFRADDSSSESEEGGPGDLAANG